MKQAILALLSIVALCATSAKAVQVDSPAPPTSPNSAMFSLEDVYNRLSTGTAGAKRTGGFTDPTTGPIASRHTLNDVMTAAPASDTNGAAASQVLASKTYWSLLGGSWGTGTGTMPNNGSVTLTPSTANQIIALGYHDGTGKVVGDANLITANIRSGVNIFGVAGSPTVVDTITGTATAGDIASGKIAFVNGVATTGTLSSLPMVGDVTGTTDANTVSTVGGIPANVVAGATNAVGAATDLPIPFSLVLRDINGDFSAGVVTADLIGNVTGNVSGSAGSFTGTLTGDVTGPQGATIVSTISGFTAASVAAGAGAANAATNSNNPSTIVKRDPSGNFAAGTIAANLSGNATTATTAGNVTGVVAIANGGTGSSTQNFVDLSTPQSIGGSKTFTAVTKVSNTFEVDPVASNTGFSNNFLGNSAGSANTSGNSNTFLGNGSGSSNTTSSQCTYVGANAGVSSTGAFNTIVGSFAGVGAMTGTNNSFFGQSAGNVTTSGGSNTFIGQQAGANNTTGSNNIYIGPNAGGTTGATNSNNIMIGTSGNGPDNNVVRLGSSQTDTFLVGVVHGDGSLLTNLNSATSFTGALFGDVTGTQNATVVSSVGGQSAANIASATQLSNSGASGAGFFGSGNDGDFTASGNMTLTRDMYYNNLTINSGVNVNSGGYRIYVKRTLTFSGGGAVIQNNGGQGTSSGPFPGAAGGNSGVFAGGAAANPTSNGGGPGTGGNGTSNSIGAAGGNGGGSNSFGPGGTGGSVSSPSLANGGLGILNALPNALTGRDLSNTQVTGGGSGGGGGAGANWPGGGGGGGGIVMIAAKLITGTGAIQANGGNGGSSAGVNEAGGGGGGGGAAIVISSGIVPGTVTISANGGAAGTGGTSTTPANPGSAGQVILLTP